MPINSEDIPNFKEWINWNGFSHKHKGFDFAAYIERGGDCMLGLLEKTPVRAIDEGIVRKIGSNQEGIKHAYYMDIIIEHFFPYLISGYTHVVPCIKERQEVRKGDVIATLYKDPGKFAGRLVHLHFYLTRAFAYIDEENSKYLIDPQKIFGEISNLIALPQGEQLFSIPTTI